MVAAAIGDHLRDEVRDGLVVFTRDFHIDPGNRRLQDGPSSRFVRTWPDHWSGTWGAEVHTLLQPALTAQGAVEFRKGAHAAAYSGFEAQSAEGIGLEDYLRSHRCATPPSRSWASQPTTA